MEVLQRTANRGSISTGEYDIDNSLKLEADNTEYLYKANDSGTNRKTFTVSMWFKRTELADDYMQLWQGGVNGEATRMGFFGGTPKEAIWVDIGGGSGNTGADYRSYSVQVARDTSAWYHIVLAVDTTQSTAANRLKVWLNGDEITTWTNQAIPAQDFQCALEASIQMKWGAYDNTYYKMSGYIAECHYLDGVAKVQTDFGEYDEDSGIWKPKAYTGTYGGNGCYLNFDDSSDLGADSSGNGNNFTLNNITSADQATDTPTNNFATFNPIWTAADITYSEGATRMTSGANGWETALSTIGVSSGKWYFEIKQSATDGSAMYGVADEADIYNLLTDHLGSNNTGGNSVSYYGNDGVIRINGVGVVTYGTWAQNQKMGCALDLDNGKVYFALQNTWQNSSNPENGTNALTLPTGGNGLWFFGANQYFGTETLNANFGGYTSFGIDSAETDENGYGSFEFAPPSGYYALCTKNLAEYG
jgi:hypothetical protein